MLKTLFCLATCLLVTPFANAKQYSAPKEAELLTAQQTFKFRGEWIHPKIIQELLPWESDIDFPLVTAIDVSAATGTNRFSGKMEQKNGRISFADGEGLVTEYEWKGRLKNGMHVLVVRQFGSGTMVSTSLAVLNLSTKSAYKGNGDKYPRLLLEAERFVTLGDRASVKVLLADNSIDVDVSCKKSCDSKHLTLTF